MSRVQQAILNKIPDPEAMQQMMDMLSGVSAYVVGDMGRQGAIKRLFEKECKRYYTRNNDYSNFSINLDDIVSIYWETIFKDLPEAKVFGTMVTTRAVKGQDQSNAAGIVRKTNANPINWLKMRGTMGVRNAINKIYNQNLIQVCDDCGHKSKADSREVDSIACPKCASKNTLEHWPDGNSTYKATKERSCLECKEVWKRRFAYVCAGCLSTSVHIESRFDSKDAETYDLANEEPTIEERYVEQELEEEVKTIIAGTYSALPLNPDPLASPTDTKARAILDVIFDPIVSKDICNKCIAKADSVCSVSCPEFKTTKSCIHFKMKNPKQTCGAESFSLDKCINYSKKIGDYHGVSATLSSRRIQTIRKYFIKYVSENRNIDLCDSLYSILKKQGKLLVY